MGQTYYIDTCVWLNLIKKEGYINKGKPYWQIAAEFIAWALLSEGEIVFSGLVLKEIYYKLTREVYTKAECFIKSKARFVKMREEDKVLARTLEKEFCYEISFYDCAHIAFCIRLECVLVTRDKKLLELARKYIIAKKPEDLAP